MDRRNSSYIFCCVLLGFVVVAAARDVEYRREDGEKTVVFAEDHKHCMIFANGRAPQASIAEFLLRGFRWFDVFNSRQVVTQSHEEFRETLHRCRQVQVANLRDGERPPLRQDIIYPGTAWCGAGNAADGFYDLGIFEELDKCCRIHDFCPDYIRSSSFNPLYNLTNEMPFTNSHCDCDRIFQECLKTVNDEHSQAVGDIFFNLVTLPCFRKDYPILQCLEWGGLLGTVCLQYELDFTQEPIWQFFSNPVYAQNNRG